MGLQIENPGLETDVPPPIASQPGSDVSVWWFLAGTGLLVVCCSALVVSIGLAVIVAPSLQHGFTSLPAFPGQPTPHASASRVPVKIESTPSIAVLAPAPFDYPNPKENSVGDPSAPVQIVEFGDYQCPFCAKFWGDTEKSIIRNYVATGKVYFTFRSVNFIGPESARAGEAAYCAAEQGEFWGYHDYLFTNQGIKENDGTFTVPNLSAFARGLGLDMAQFNDCLIHHKYAARVERDNADAQLAGIQGTPAFLIDNHVLEGAQSYEQMALIIEALLKGVPQEFPPPEGRNGWLPSGILSGF